MYHSTKFSHSLKSILSFRIIYALMPEVPCNFKKSCNNWLIYSVYFISFIKNIRIPLRKQRSPMTSIWRCQEIKTQWISTTKALNKKMGERDPPILQLNRDPLTFICYLWKPITWIASKIDDTGARVPCGVLWSKNGNLFRFAMEEVLKCLKQH